jgi:hypothetical protein
MTKIYGHCAVCKVVYRDPSTQGETLHYAVKLDRGVSFEDAQAVYEEQRTTMGEKRWAQAVGEVQTCDTVLCNVIHR